MKHSDFDLRWHSYEPRRLLPQLPLRTSRQLFLRCSMINRSPRFALRYVQTHWKKTLNRKLLSARNCMWIKGPCRSNEKEEAVISWSPAERLILRRNVLAAWRPARLQGVAAHPDQGRLYRQLQISQDGPGPSDPVGCGHAQRDQLRSQAICPPAMEQLLLSISPSCSESAHHQRPRLLHRLFELLSPAAHLRPTAINEVLLLPRDFPRTFQEGVFPCQPG